MIPLSLGEIAAVVGGTVEGDGAVTVTAPAVLDGRQAEPGGLFVAFAGEHVDGHDYVGQAGRSSSRTPRPRCRRSPPTSWPGCATG
jgi:UDP-N-acetylmuramoyl-tripeptide--D-alanyl-D-alanine ligase